jgi:hypothetical protein
MDSEWPAAERAEPNEQEAPIADKELGIITKTYDLVQWSCQHVSRFPRNHRFVLGERMERRLYELLETLVQARYTRERQALLKQANLSLEILRFQLPDAAGSRLAMPAHE